MNKLRGVVVASCSAAALLLIVAVNGARAESVDPQTACTPDALGRGGDKKEKEEVMRNLLMAAATGALLVAAVPASAQVYMGADPGGAGVQVGPFGFGVGPRYGYDRWRGDEYRGDAYYAYGAECPLVKERIVTADGRRIIRTHRSCR